jgi:hypothetical protein
VKDSRTILKDFISLIKTPRLFLQEILEDESFKLTKKILFFLVFMQTYLLILPSSLIYLMILVLPFFAIMLTYLYFFAQELSILYLEFNQKEVKDDFLYKLAYCICLISIPSMLVSILINLWFLFNAENFIVGSFYSLVWSLVPLVLYLTGIYYLVRFVSNSQFGLLKIIELICLSITSVFKSKFGFEIIEEIKFDLSRLNT